VTDVPDFAALRDAALTVRQVLRDGITLSDDPGLTGIEVDLRSPHELEQAVVTGVISLWTHRVEVQPDLVNRSPQRIGPDLEARRSLPVEVVLHATAMIDDASSALLVSGRILQLIFDHRRLSDPQLLGSLAATGTELFLAFEPLTAYDTNLIWSGLHASQRVGLGIRMSGLLIDSELPPLYQSKVLTRRGAVDEILEVV
jgi:hypothetical protein